MANKRKKVYGCNWGGERGPKLSYWADSPQYDQWVSVKPLKSNHEIYTRGIMHLPSGAVWWIDVPDELLADLAVTFRAFFGPLIDTGNGRKITDKVMGHKEAFSYLHAVQRQYKSAKRLPTVRRVVNKNKAEFEIQQRDAAEYRAAEAAALRNTGPVISKTTSFP